MLNLFWEKFQETPALVLFTLMNWILSVNLVRPRKLSRMCPLYYELFGFPKPTLTLQRGSLTHSMMISIIITSAAQRSPGPLGLNAGSIASVGLEPESFGSESRALHCAILHLII